MLVGARARASARAREPPPRAAGAQASLGGALAVPAPRVPAFASMPLLRAVARTLTAQNALARAASAAGAARRAPGGAPGGGAAGVLRAFAGASSAPQMTEEARQVLVKKLIYRSGMRGWLELDLILGKWAQDHLPSMPAEELTQYAVVRACACACVRACRNGLPPHPTPPTHHNIHTHQTQIHRVRALTRRPHARTRSGSPVARPSCSMRRSPTSSSGSPGKRSRPSTSPPTRCTGASRNTSTSAWRSSTRRVRARPGARTGCVAGTTTTSTRATSDPTDHVHTTHHYLFTAAEMLSSMACRIAAAAPVRVGALLARARACARDVRATIHGPSARLTRRRR